MCSFVSGATEGCLLNHSAAGSQPIYHLAIMLMSRSEVYTETKDLLRLTFVFNTLMQKLYE